MEFLDARNKLEAVARISNLTNSGPEILGPGSKEHKSVFLNLANGLGIKHDLALTKQGLGKLILETLGGTWTVDFESVGQTITLKGLNELLRRATRFLERNGTLNQSLCEETFEQELNSISRLVVANTPLVMEGKSCVEEMRAVEDANWRQTEWQGFYFEMKIESALARAIGGERQKFHNTEFDYVRNYIWDLKMHSSRNKDGKPSTGLILNDSRAINQAVEAKGIGFIILSAVPTYDKQFTRWHKEYRGGGTDEPTRVLKSNFISERLDFFYIPNTNRLLKAMQESQLGVMAQGKNSNGKPRPTKYSLDLMKARDTDLQVFTHNFT